MGVLALCDRKSLRLDGGILHYVLRHIMKAAQRLTYERAETSNECARV